MKKIGIIGGMGPLASAHFYLRFLEQWDAKSDQDHPDMVLINHASMPDRTTVIEMGDEKALLEAVREDLAIFSTTGCDFFVATCNTFHYFYDKIVKMTDIPFLNMVELTVLEAIQRWGKDAKVAVLGTSGTLASGIYQQTAKHHGLHCIRPDQEIEARLMKMIYDIKAGASTEQPDADHIIRELIVTEHIDGVLIACTELSLISYDPQTTSKRLDALDVLVGETVRMAKEK